MKSILPKLLQLAMFLLLASDATAQMIECIFDEDRTLAPDGQGELRLDVENLDFLRDNEYAGGRTDGYTLPGFMLRPTLSWQPLDRLKVEAGFNMTAYWGATSYHEVYFKDPLRYMPTGEKHRVNMTPFLRVHAKLSPAVDLVIGNIYGGVAHRLPEPLYDEENMMTGRPEAGIQLLTATRHFDLDAWVNWESFIFRNDNHQEAFTFGVSARAKVNDERSRVHAFFPVSLIYMHRGGEIDTISADRVQTWMNVSVGGQIDFNLRHKTVRRVSLSLNGFYSGESKGDLFPFKRGAAAYALAEAEIWRFKLGLGHWVGHNFITLMGNPHFGSISVPYDGQRFDDPQVTTFNLEYFQAFGKCYSWGANLKAYYLHDCHKVEADGSRDRSSGAMSIAAAVYFRLSPSFLLKDFKK